MKTKKNQSGQVITTAILKRELGKVGKRIDAGHRELMVYIDEKIAGLEERTYTKEDHDKFMMYLDEAMTELRDAREGRGLNEKQILRMDDQIDNHEKRIVSLEEKVIS
ncbi:hypothetical protein A3B60_03810 [Candidatus Peregrinibacteria bacterium RIFCSPLOWO2_01_FULL_39_12]|nr:MAG: hypothetical protein A3B60_03810 [Candidatus Peregrinibacteria bacterium RIFCSPLOWO2_01_FULL_39_12]OGJ43061.1 MAG: hypothetical protein A3I58_02025 [Candidatus Peregrinibacteria bacterium RIFCSPLOWO2_02_FULL_39_10]